MSKVSEIVAEIANPIVENQGCTLWDVEYIKEAGEWFLRVYIDKEGGVNIIDCEAISRALDPILDEKDPIPGSYTFEVCSAGAERELKRPSDFLAFIDSEVDVKLYSPINGAKAFKGKIKEYDNGRLTITCGSTDYTFEKQQVAKVNLHVDF